MLSYLQLTIDFQDLLSGVEAELGSLTSGLTGAGGSSPLSNVLKRDGVRYFFLTKVLCLQLTTYFQDILSGVTGELTDNSIVQELEGALTGKAATKRAAKRSPKSGLVKHTKKSHKN
jgi:hypothetical protein